MYILINTKFGIEIFSKIFIFFLVYIDMKYTIILCIALAGCKTAPIQHNTYTVNYNPVYHYRDNTAPLSDFDTIVLRDMGQLEKLVSHLPDAIQVTGRKPTVNVKGLQAVRGKVVQGDSNVVADRGIKKETRNVENETGWYWQVVGIVVGILVVAGLVIYFVRR